MLRYFDYLEGLTQALLQGFSLALGLSPGHLSTYYKQPLSRLKVNHYPPQHDPVSDDDIGVVPHSDSGGFTILWQDEWGGLEIQNKNGEWVGASPVEGAFVINIGRTSPGSHPVTGIGPARFTCDEEFICGIIVRAEEQIGWIIRIGEEDIFTI